MTGLDANVIVRYLAQDEPAQAARATAVFEQTLSVEEPGFVSLVAMVETVWVLRRAYRYSASETAAEIRRLLQIDSIIVQEEQSVFTAMVALEEGRGEFADALIGALDESAGCTHTLTFDRKAARLTGFQAL